MGLFRRLARIVYKPLHPPLELGAWKHHFAVASQTANADIGTNAHDPPDVPPTGMFLAHLHGVSNCQR